MDLARLFGTIRKFEIDGRGAIIYLLSFLAALLAIVGTTMRLLTRAIDDDSDSFSQAWDQWMADAWVSVAVALLLVTSRLFLGKWIVPKPGLSRQPAHAYYKFTTFPAGVISWTLFVALAVTLLLHGNDRLAQVLIAVCIVAAFIGLLNRKQDATPQVVA